MTRTWKQTLVGIPGIGLSLLPKLACPLCWPAYAGVLSSVGLGFLISTKYLLPITAALLLLALAALAFRARRRHGYGSVALGLIAAVGVMLGKFQWESDVSLYGGVGLLIVASLWNAWPLARPAGPAETCSQCETAHNVSDCMSSLWTETMLEEDQWLTRRK